MRWGVWQEMLLLTKSTKELDDTELAKKIFQQQLDMGWRPGLASEVTDICNVIGLADVTKTEVLKKKSKRKSLNIISKL